MSRDAWTFLFVLRLRVTHFVKLRLSRRQLLLVNRSIKFEKKRVFTMEAMYEPPNQTAYLCIGCVTTLTSISGGAEPDAATRALILAMLSRIRASTLRLISRSNRRPKSLNIVVPPDKTMLLYSLRRTSIGHFRIDSSTTSGRGVVKSGLKISGLKNTSGPRKRS